MCRKTKPNQSNHADEIVFTLLQRKEIPFKSSTVEPIILIPWQDTPEIYDSQDTPEIYDSQDTPEIYES